MVRSLNEGRSGRTGNSRPGEGDGLAAQNRSTKAGPAGPATRRRRRRPRRRPTALNEGRSGRTGNSRISRRCCPMSRYPAQRRPVRPDRQLAGALRPIPVPCSRAQRRPVRPDRQLLPVGHRLAVAERAQRRPVRPDRQLGTLGAVLRLEDRSTKAGPAGPATQAAEQLVEVLAERRSTKAGPAGPATHAPECRTPCARARALNEGRSGRTGNSYARVSTAEQADGAQRRPVRPDRQLARHVRRRPSS